MKKGFTLVELLGVIIVIAILSGLAVISISSIIDKGKNDLYKDYEKTLEVGTQNYLINHYEKMPKENNQTTITYKNLMDDDSSYKSLKDPRGNGTCDNSYIIVTRGVDIGVNYNLNYKVCLVCDNYKSENC